MSDCITHVLQHGLCTNVSGQDFIEQDFIEVGYPTRLKGL